MKLYLSTSSRVEVTRENDPDVEYSGEDTDTSWSFGPVSLTQPRAGAFETIEVGDGYAPGDRVFLVGGVYNTGDSFSHHEWSSFELFSAHRTRDAAKLAETALSGAGADAKDVDLGDGYVVASLPWFGQFVSLGYVDIVEEAIVA